MSDSALAARQRVARDLGGLCLQVDELLLHELLVLDERAGREADAVGLEERHHRHRRHLQPARRGHPALLHALPHGVVDLAAQGEVLEDQPKRSLAFCFVARTLVRVIDARWLDPGVALDERVEERPV
eukprot:2325643-Rhodomonas_salina.3